MTSQKPAQQHQPHTPLSGERLRRVGRAITLTALLLLLTSGLGIGYALLQINDDHINELVNEKSAHITQGHAEITHGGRQIILAEKHETTCTVHSSSGSPIPVNPGKSHVKGDEKSHFGIGAFEAPAGTYDITCTPNKGVVILPETAMESLKTAGTIAAVSVVGILVFTMIALSGAVLWASGARSRAKAIAANQHPTYR
ncbi:hypothetical protein [Dermatophilus congolensis]|uniref:hypothetical protein n=1 Tax=Dermatophilus congolensis TaxID=1863 RepID=UPI001AAE67CC|nr:hypothetical protein [Dermatophilus congolensis]MBO3142383.1 hypothetical protein [Dermatophilus congolensis]MBO3151374.1 hypothetical protein [Dermatophilus congolensis]MBO3161622.1 hypothetical protein [Dermatophilus congolensis]MBO3162660.1 hypothetical protein [Dermatophilus congolensis]MBO3176213.1 hypothetical protein [Dermatophilus congolensis]